MSLPIKIHCKKLSSGKCQVKFSAQVNDHPYYGYLLTNPQDKLKDVMAIINNKLKQKDALHQHLYCIGKASDRDFFLYKS